MLLERPPRPAAKKLHLAVGNPSFRRLLRGLLEKWKYVLQEEAGPAAVTLLLEGAPPKAAGEVLRLGGRGARDEHRLALPLSVEQLWLSLEARFHTPPRRHIRMACDLPATVRARGEHRTATLTSLSDLGGRFIFHRELAKQEELVVDFRVDGVRLPMNSQVIYAMPLGDLGGTEGTQIGVLFDYRQGTLRTLLREYIIRSYLEEIRRQIPQADFLKGLDFFSLPERVEHELRKPPPEAGRP